MVDLTGLTCPRSPEHHHRTRSMRWAIASSLVSLLSGALVVLGLSALETRLNSERQIAGAVHTHTYEVQVVVGQVDAAIRGLEANQRNLLLTKQAVYQQLYESRRKMAYRLLTRADELTADNPQQQQRMSQLRTILTAKLAELDDQTATVADVGLTRIIERIADPVNLERNNSIRDLLRAIEAQEAELLSARQVTLASLEAHDEQVASLLEAAGVVMFLITAISTRLAWQAWREFARADELSRGHTQLREMTDDLPVILWTSLPDGRHSFISNSFYRFTGLVREPMDAFSWKPWLHPDDVSTLDQVRTAAFRAREPYEIECRFRSESGQHRWMLLRCRPVMRGQGDVIRWVGSAVDIEDIVTARNLVSRGMANLEETVASRTEELTEVQNRLMHVQRMEALGQLAGGIAHDFNNVLQAIQSAVGLVERMAEGQAPILRLVRIMLDATERGASITGRLLVFARRGELRSEVIPAQDLLRSVQELLTHTLASNIVVEVDCTADACLISDRGQLETVLINLAANSRDAMPDGGVLALRGRNLIVDQEDPAIHLSRGSFCRLSVQDSGIGMPLTVLNRATEPFFTTKPIGRGTGLGLAMVRGFVEQSGGAMSITSVEGQGTVVDLWLPSCISVTAGVASAEDVLAQHVHILLVDDDVMVREITADQLGLEGYTVTSLPSGLAVLDALRSGLEVDILISDLSMPGMDGVTTIAEAQKIKPGLPAILLTGYLTPDLPAEDVAKFVVMSKPSSVRQIAAHINRLLTPA